MKKILFVVPARSGSVRLKNKNILPFLGNCLFTHTLSFLRSTIPQLTSYSCHVCISTNDPEILSCSHHYPEFNFVARDKNLCNSTASLEDVCDILLSNYSLQGNKFDYVCLLQVTSPLRELDLIPKALSRLLRSNSNGLIELEEHKLHLGTIKDNIWLPDDLSSLQSQALPPKYKPSGRLFIFKVGTDNKIFRGGFMPTIINPDYINNIDTLDDFVLAESKGRRIRAFDYLFRDPQSQ